ncbi:MAG: hypothetical protein RL689_1316 [Planctomycetota bacterium]
MRHIHLAPVALASLAGLCAAQPIVFTEWNFNSFPSGQILNNPAPSTGRGVASPLGMTNNYTFFTSPQRTGSFTMCDTPSAGASSDTASSPNQCWRVRGSFDTTLANAGIGWSIFAPQYTQGAEFAVSTANYTGVSFSFDWFTTNQGVRHMQVRYSTDAGATWNNIGPARVSATNGWVNGTTVDFSSVPGVNNNPNFRVRLVSTFDPAPAYSWTQGFAYTGASGGQYNNASGNWRFDKVAFTGTPIGPVPPAGTAAVDSPAVCSSGGQLTFTVSTVAGAAPPSTGMTVTGNLAGLGLAAAQPFFDNGTNGDQFAGDGVFTYVATVPAGRPLGTATVPVAIADAQGRSASASVDVAVGDCSNNSAARIVISQVFGGGGNLGATPSQDAPYDADFVEILNRSSQVVDLTGWSVQYTSPGKVTGFDNAEDRVNLAGLIRPGQAMLVRMSDPVPGFGPLPTPDFAQLPGFGGMGNTGGRVALVRSTTLLGTNYARVDIEDFVGYGTAAISFEGVAPTPTTANNTSATRKSGGEQDTNQNFNDFTIGGPMPRNRASNGFLAGTPSSNVAAACGGTDVVLRVAVVPGATSTGIAVTANVAEIAGSSVPVVLRDNGTGGDQTSVDGVFSATYTVPPGAPQGQRTIVFTTSDQQGRSDVSRLPFAVAVCEPNNTGIVISQVYGGGGNSGSGFNGDFAEIFNRSGTPVDLTGWSFQSARVTDQGFDSRIAFLSGVINPGEYRLIVTNQLSPTGAVLPAADFTPATAFGMESSFGRVVLVASTVLVGTDYDRPDVVDLVGYGQLAQSFEGVAPTAALSNTLVAVRKNNGCQDTNQNAIDFDVVLALQLPRNSSTPASICPGVSICGCAADYNADGGVDGSDVGGFFADWEAAAGCSDVNQDGGVDGSDIEAFFAVWEQGGC